MTGSMHGYPLLQLCCIDAGGQPVSISQLSSHAAGRTHVTATVDVQGAYAYIQQTHSAKAWFQLNSQHDAAVVRCPAKHAASNGLQPSRFLLHCRKGCDASLMLSCTVARASTCSVWQNGPQP